MRLSNFPFFLDLHDTTCVSCSEASLQQSFVRQIVGPSVLGPTVYLLLRLFGFCESTGFLEQFQMWLMGHSG